LEKRQAKKQRLAQFLEKALSRMSGVGSFNAPAVAQLNE
jgi:hypothetical protein